MGSAVLGTFGPFRVDMPCSGGEVEVGQVLSLSLPLQIGSCRHSQLDRAKRGEDAGSSRSRVSSRRPCVTSDGAQDEFERRVTARTDS